ncbi:MAG: hypothetical protein JNJ98_03800 [Gemmatimonadetes bacterium]|nr:hypothetical protein [Gemmatimonadota bacterium]
MRPIGPEVHSALLPLAQRLAALTPADRLAWLDELRPTAPVFTEVLERMLAGETGEVTTDGFSSEAWGRVWTGLLGRRGRRTADESPEETHG